MNFDLSFTQDGNWIANRQKAWEEIEDDVAEERTKKQLEGIKKYFFTGVIPKGSRVTPGGVVLFFPSYSYEGLAFAIKKYIDASSLMPHQYRNIQCSFSLNLDYWPGATREEKLNLFKMVFGEAYDPSRKFPFLIGEETEYRDFTDTAGGLFSIIVGNIVGWCRCDEEELLVWPDLVDFMLSIIPYAEPWMFKQKLSDEESKTKLGGLSVGEFCRCLEELMQYIINPPKEMRETPHFSLKKQKLHQIGLYLDNLEAPKELVDHWQWAKQEFTNE